MIFMASTKTRMHAWDNQTAIVGVCTAILLKHHFQHNYESISKANWPYFVWNEFSENGEKSKVYD